MGKILEHYADMIIPEVPDRHANRLSIYKSKGGQYRINFRNIQVRLTAAQFAVWQRGFGKAQAKLGTRMAHDVIVPLTAKQVGRERTQTPSDAS